MRLLRIDDRREFHLADYLADDTPPYAILSHTWGEDHEEVNFNDLATSSSRAIAKYKPGYRKLLFCASQAAHDGLMHFWVDTCAIDKSNHVELQEAINSMFRWYQNAARCYVYLSDVSTDHPPPASQSWEQAFQKSRWFTRGWTLQELLAPPMVEFFCCDGTRLGDKSSLERQLQNVTGIAIEALRGTSLSTFSVEERMSWAEARQTKRSEDKAYSLLGIFGIHMPLIYGEGIESATFRLREEIDKRFSRERPSLLDRLPYADEASFNAHTKRHESECLPNTRVDLLQEIYNWANGPDERLIFWLNGFAGTGKSTIARTVSRTYFDKQCLGASFFFSRGGADVGHASHFFTTISRQLANNIPVVYQHVCDAIKAHGDIMHLSLRDQWRHLVVGPLSKLASSSCPPVIVVVVDALDECDDEDDIQTILYLLAEARLLENVRLRIFLTSRPEVPIRHGLRQIPTTEHQDFVLHSISPSTINHDISSFLEYNLQIIGQKHFLGASWPGDEAIRSLVQFASGLFIWAATACRFIQEGKRFATKRLDTILRSNASSINPPEKYLDQIYITVLQHCVSPAYTDEEKEELYSLLRQLLGSIVVLFSPLSIYSLSELLGTTKEDILQTLDDLHSVLDVPTDDSQPLRLHHPSFRDFLLNRNRCSVSNFWVDEKNTHDMLAERCVGIMSASLKQNLFGFESFSVSATEIGKSQMEKFLPVEVQYACLYWIQHLKRGCTVVYDNGYVHQFFQEHLLHWLEALGWMGKVSDGVHAILSLESIIATCDCARLTEYVYDIKRFMLYNLQTVELAPLQTYCSALVFTPKMSIVRKRFAGCIPQLLRSLPVVEQNWNAELQTLEGHSSYVITTVFAPNGKLLASASFDDTVKLWDAGSGAVLQTLEGHSKYIGAVAFSPDGKLLASGSMDWTIKLWDTGSGLLLQTLEGHLGAVSAIVFSRDGTLLASASNDSSVRLWDVKSRTLLLTLQEHLHFVFAVAFSSDGGLLATASKDCTVRLWDTALGESLHIVKGHLGSVYTVVFSPDGKLLASGSEDKTVGLWEVGSEVGLRMLGGHSNSVNTVVFSPDGKLLASSSEDCTVRLWDAGSGAALHLLGGHSGSVNGVTFSPNGKLLASPSHDTTVRLWDTRTGDALQTLKGHSDYINSAAFSPDSKLLASASFDHSVKLWDTGSRSCEILQHLDDHSDEITSLAFSPDGKLLATSSDDGTVKLWDVGTNWGAIIQTFKGHSNCVTMATFSPDGKLLASSSLDDSIKLWDPFSISGVALHTFESNSGFVLWVAFSPDSKLLASAAYDHTVRLWNTESGAALHTLHGHSGSVHRALFSPDGKLLASSSSDHTVRLWDAESGAGLQTIETHSDNATSVAFSPDGNLLALACLDQTVRIWDVGTATLLQTLNINSYADTLSFSDDGLSLWTEQGNFYRAFPTEQFSLSPVEDLPRLYVKGHWICSKGKEVLWLPTNYRPTHTAICGSMIGFSTKSRRVVLLELAC